MSLRTRLAVVCVALPAMVAAILIVEHQGSSVATTTSLRSLPAVATPQATEARRSTAISDPPQTDEAAAIAYAAMRDDVNPKPRLQLIDAWARGAPAAAPLDLPSLAMVDPDESVRSRAQELFDRRIQGN